MLVQRADGWEDNKWMKADWDDLSMPDVMQMQSRTYPEAH